ncbi:MAG: ATP-binding protein [Clostridium sp.]|nr:ATP-binding protein [Clostridium sp.]
MFNHRDSVISFVSYIYQMSVFLYAVSKCLKEEKKDMNKWIASFFICSLTGIMLSVLLESHAMAIIELHSISFFLVCGIIYREKMYDAMTAYSLCYYLCLIYSIAKDTLFEIELGFIWVNIIAGILFMIIYWYSLKGVTQLFDVIKHEEQYKVFIVVLSFIADIFLIFDEITSQNQVMMIELTLVKICFAFLIINVIHFTIRYFKMKKIIKLNNKLSYTNNELRNIKEHHGKVIDMMYKLYGLGQNDEIGMLLKDIINSDRKDVKVIKSEEKKSNSILEMAMMEAAKDGILIDIDEEYSVELACIDRMELYRIISNIISNARQVVGKNGIINAETYKEEDKIIIIIENNGPKIDEEHIKRIFQAGFTTKDNNDKSHGYGLNIVKELVEKNQGNIGVESSDLSTAFKIVLPCN